jgi:hypothetical protein
MSANPPAGWYPDPHGQAELRYWDGNTWTEHTSGEPAGPGPTQLDQPQAAAAPQAGAAQYETQDPYQDPYAAGAPAAAPGRAGGGPPKPLLFGLGAVLLIGVVVGVLLLTGVFGGDDEPAGKTDEEQITELIEDTYENPTDADTCDNWTEEYHDSVEGGEDNCAPELETNSENIDYEIKSVEVDGDEGTAEVEVEGNESDIDVKKEDDEWKIDGFVAAICCIGGYAEDGTDTGTDTGTADSPEEEVTAVVESWLSAIQTKNGAEFCRYVTYNFMRDHGVRGQDDQLTDRCENQADRIIDDLIIAEGPSVDTVDVPSGSGFVTAKVTLTDTSKLDVVGEPGEFWLIDTFV